ncbi:SdpI family protein [Anaerococcus porci]|uniref:SdpI family protein n=1 Tax=Anaerococcus porci TaxID=2652269 RepID=UPI002A75FC83|nr:SdpI family protein [Anaerococcus porci]MDY3007056.1 SdpI family protein [Anaerococcus porci]
MGSLIVGNIMLLFFSIYIGVFFRKFYTSYPKMKVGFHIWEVCYSKETWNYGNKFAGKVSIVLGIVIFGLIYPCFLYLRLYKNILIFNRNLLIFIFIVLIVIYLVLLLQIVRWHMRKKFNLRDEKED